MQKRSQKYSFPYKSHLFWYSIRWIIGFNYLLNSLNAVKTCGQWNAFLPQTSKLILSEEILTMYQSYLLSYRKHWKPAILKLKTSAKSGRHKVEKSTTLIHKDSVPVKHNWICRKTLKAYVLRRYLKHLAKPGWGEGGTQAHNTRAN